MPDEPETSAMLHYHPELTDLTKPARAKPRIQGGSPWRRGVVWTPRDWSLAAPPVPTLGVGDPSAATS